MKLPRQNNINKIDAEFCNLASFLYIFVIEAAFNWLFCTYFQKYFQVFWLFLLTWAKKCDIFKVKENQREKRKKMKEMKEIKGSLWYRNKKKEENADAELR